MKLRDYTDKHPRAVMAVAAAAVLVGVVVVVWQLRDGGESLGPGQGTVPKRFFTVDDGKSYFADTMDKVPPFTTAENKTAYGAQVVRCGQAQPYVAYVEKYTDAQKKKLEEMFRDERQRFVAIEAITAPLEYPGVKMPLSDSGWVDPRNAAQYEKITRVTCRDGSVPQRLTPPE